MLFQNLNRTIVVFTLELVRSDTFFCRSPERCATTISRIKKIHVYWKRENSGKVLLPIENFIRVQFFHMKPNRLLRLSPTLYILPSIYCSTSRLASFGISRRYNSRDHREPLRVCTNTRFFVMSESLCKQQITPS